MKRGILGFFTFLFITIFSAHAMAVSYSCDKKQYDSCNSGYYMTVDGVYNGTPKVGNACTACHIGAKYCPGGTFAPMYAITLNANGGTAGNITTIYRTQGNGWYYNTTDTSIGTKITTLTSAQLPTRPGYTFNGFTSSTGTQIIKNDGTIASGYDSGMGTIIYAQWTLNTYTIKYDANGGTGTMSNTTCTYGSDCTLRTNAFTKTGYTFAGWTYDGKSYSNGQSVPNLTPTNGATLTFTAQWTANTYAVTLNGNGANYGNTTCTNHNIDADVFYTYDTNVFKCYTTDAKNAIKPHILTGYELNGYYTSASGGTKVINADGTLVAKNLITSDTTLYAQWTPNTYTIKYDANGGSGTMSNTTCTYGSDCTLRTNAFTKTGYTFAGWTYNDISYSNGQTVSNLTSTNGATLTFTAKWTANTYTLTLDRNGATSGDTTATIQYGANGFCSAGSKTDTTCSLNIYTPYKTGYRFNGYFTEQTGGTMWIDNNGYPVSSTIITSSRTLYAQYTANKYSCPAGEYLSGTSCVTCPAGSYCPGVTDQEYTGGDIGVITCPENSSTRGLTGQAYCTCDDGYNNNGETTTMYSACVANTYTLTYQPRAGTGVVGTMPDKTCTYGQDCIVDTNTFTRTGYTFNGWMCYGGNCNGGISIPLNKNFKNTETRNGVTLTIIPEWTVNKYTCVAGKYLSGTSCVTCPAGSYCPGVTDQEYTGGTHGLNTCPAGYNDDASVGKSSVSDCKIRCVGGYIAKQYDTRCTDVGVGNWAPLKYVGYGQTSSPESCPDGMLSSGFGVSSDEIGDCGRILWVNNSPVFAGYVKKTTPSLNIKYQNTVYYASMTPVSELSSDYKEWQEDIMHVNYKGVKYAVHDDRMSTTLLDTDDAYLESSGTQYIDLGYYPTDNTRVKVTMMDTRSDAGAETVYRWLFGNISRASGGKTTCFGLGTYLENWYTEISGSNISVAPLDVNTKYSLTFTVPELYFNNQSYKTKGSYATYTPADYPMYMFANNNAGAIYDQLFVGRIYDFKIYESDKLVRHLVPVPAGKQIGDFIVPQNGMWDIVEWKFYANKGTGNFVYGIAN